MKHIRLGIILLLAAATLACTLPTLGRTPTPAPAPTPTVAAALATSTMTIAPPTATPVPVLPSPTPTQGPAATPTGPVPTPPADVRGPAFATYVDVAVALPERYEGQSLPLDLAEVDGLDQWQLSDAGRALLEQNGFVVIPADWIEFYPLYDETRYQQMPVFVTTDSVYHVYHLIFDKMLRDLESERFEPDIRALTAACLASARDLYAELTGTPLEEVARSVVAYFSVANALIAPDDPVPSEVAELVAAELALIYAHEGVGGSPIFSQQCPAECDPCDANPPSSCMDQPCLCEDYSQYVPRGHYTRSEALERYFRTMMWYGRINMRLQRPFETRMALLITYILNHTAVNGGSAADVWARVYEPTVFIVGKADDLGFHEYGALWDAVFGPDAPITAVADDAGLATFTAAARQLPPPQINSMWVYISEDEDQVTQGFRFMGQRFVLDAYIFEQLVWREVGTQQNPRWLPKGLDILAAMGSDEAYTILEEMGETEYAKYPEQMAKLREQVSGLEMDSWTQNLYWSWLYSFFPLLEAKGEQYPAFMSTTAWARKDLHTALGSWTELKHDTILYAKQVMAEMGGGGPPELPRGWVEPNPEVYARLLALVDMTDEGLRGRDLLSENTGANLERLRDLLGFLLRVSESELAGEQLSDEDYMRLDYYGGELEAITLAAADQEGEGRPFFEDPEQAALVADVATDPNGQVLEEAIGRIFEIYAAIPDGQGGLQLARGGVFSYYEFPWPMSDRLTDEAWQQMLGAGAVVPDRPAWTEIFIAE